MAVRNITPDKTAIFLIYFIFYLFYMRLKEQLHEQ